MWLMGVKYFKLIKTIAEEGNIARSSEKLFLTQSALSHQLRELEEQIGFKVFIRDRGAWKLTSEGEELYKLSTEVIQTPDDGLDRIQPLRDPSKVMIRMGKECSSSYQGVPAFV